MQILYYHCFAGISGDMNLGAMADLGVPVDYLKSVVDQLNLPGVALDFTEDERNGIYGTRATVTCNPAKKVSRKLADIEEIITSADLPEAVIRTAMEMFRNLAEAEARIHRKTPETIHFHEVGGEDAMVDIVGAAAAYHYLSPDEVWTSEIELGSGTIKAAHGVLPVPAPATALILENAPVHIGGTDIEATTPTGAAILKTLTTKFVPAPAFNIRKTGIGVGQSRTGKRPNILRVHLAETDSQEQEYNLEQAFMLECTVDDMNPEWYEHIMDRLFHAGAADVTLTPVIMKKNRPGMIISVLCTDEASKTIGNLLLTETTSLGYRKINVEKTFLDRRIRSVETSLGTVRVKESYSAGKVYTRKPEYEDCRKIALEKGISLKEVYQKVWKEISGLE